MRTLLVSFIAALTMTAGGAYGADATSAPAYTVLDETGSQLREDFNRAKGSVRVLFVVDPVCPGCLRGLDDLNKALLANTQDPRLQTFVVHVPVLHPAATAKDVPPAAELLHNAHVRNYWRCPTRLPRLVDAVRGPRHRRSVPGIRSRMGTGSLPHARSRSASVAECEPTLNEGA